MSATLAMLLHELDPDIRLLIVERLSAPGLESSSAFNNAGTGHAANCELNYTPLQSDGTVKTSKALTINSSFEQSLEFWSSLTEKGNLDPTKFLHFLPHISFVWGEKDVGFLKQRFKQLRHLSAFSTIEWSSDREELASWMPIVMRGRDPSQVVAATRIQRGTDVDFGALTSAYLDSLILTGALDLRCDTEVINLERNENESWHLELKGQSGNQIVQAPFVFLGAGGGALPLLQKSGIHEGQGYGGFPVSGQWLICSDMDLIGAHEAKVYGKAKLGAPPMSVPHLDSRWIAGRRSLLFGPYAGFSTKFLKNGSSLDWFRSLKLNNFGSMIQVGIENMDLVKYLLRQLRQTDEDRIDALLDFLPNANLQDWNLDIAGQRVQIIKSTSQGGTLMMGTEVVTSSDGSLAALLGASPGASTAVTIMLEILNRCWREQMESDLWQERIRQILPSFGGDLINDVDLLMRTRMRSDYLLGIE